MSPVIVDLPPMPEHFSDGTGGHDIRQWGLQAQQLALAAAARGSCSTDTLQEVEDLCVPLNATKHFFAAKGEERSARGMEHTMAILRSLGRLVVALQEEKAELYSRAAAALQLVPDGVELGELRQLAEQAAQDRIDAERYRAAQGTKP